MVLVFEHEEGIFDVIYFYFINLATNDRVKIYMCGMCTVNKYFCVLLALNINPHTTREK